MPSTVRSRPAINSRGRPPLRVLHAIVDVAYVFLIFLMWPLVLWRLATDGKARSRWRAYLRDVPARFGRRIPRPADAPPCLWVHGVSVGEIKAAARLVERIEEEVPGIEVVLSATTDTGRRVAIERYPGHRIEYFPPDASWLARNALDALRPDLVLLVESEIWPNFLCAAKARSIPVVLVNGRMSARSARGFGRWPWIARPLIGALDAIFVQIEAYAERFMALGAAPSGVRVTGNMKFDNIPFKAAEGPWPLASSLGLANGPPVLVAGSTHPGEERALARIQQQLAARGQPLRLVVAPRHPSRRDAVEADIRREGGIPVLRSRMAEPPLPTEVLVLDSVGELEAVYGCADFVFVGGTLVPHGGQNMMEPASLGKPVAVGPYTNNFRGEMALLLHAKGVVQVADAPALGDLIQTWLADRAAAQALGERGREALLASKGATERTVAGLAHHLARLRSL